MRAASSVAILLAAEGALSSRSSSLPYAVAMLSLAALVRVRDLYASANGMCILALQSLPLVARAVMTS